ncbi:hypothetical protein A2U01_0087689 [Trifolium medium]|uniref:Uncharacterized protein n=1 Tax=Trifolium medium TaxID=97028 RepID=A0A392TZ41_9FABA|nr:hypothetical protein [Trifolium medium]
MANKGGARSLHDDHWGCSLARWRSLGVFALKMANTGGVRSIDGEHCGCSLSEQRSEGMFAEQK